MVSKLNKNRKTYIVVFFMIISVILIVSVFFIKDDYKILKMGNNISMNTTEDITKYILNISSYSAKIELTINSNKNTNKYILIQQFVSPNISKQEILEPSNIKGLTMTFDGDNLKIENTYLKINHIYKNYNYLSNNNLFLDSFIEDYKNSKDKKTYEEKDMYIMETKCESNNRYIVSKKLYIDKSTSKPIRMEVNDVNQSTLVYILYNEIKINSTKTEEVLAFKTSDYLFDI